MVLGCRLLKAAPIQPISPSGGMKRWASLAASLKPSSVIRQMGQNQARKARAAEDRGKWLITVQQALAKSAGVTRTPPTTPAGGGDAAPLKTAMAPAATLPPVPTPPSAAVQALVDSVGRLHEMMDSRTAAIQQAADVRANSLQASVDALVEQNRAMQAHIDRLSESAGTPLVLTNNGSENHESVSEL